MNEIDKSWARTLSYFADNTRAKVMAEKEDDEKYFKEILPDDLKNTFIEFGYLDFKTNTKHIITQAGLQQLRDLEQIQKRDWTFRISVIALIISILSFAVARGWIKF